MWWVSDDDDDDDNHLQDNAIRQAPKGATFRGRFFLSHFAVAKNQKRKNRQERARPRLSPMRATRLQDRLEVCPLQGNPAPDSADVDFFF